MSLKQRVLQALKETDGYISGQMLSENLAVSRTAIWKVIKQLKEQGYEIDSISNKGYRLVVKDEQYNQEELELACKASWAGSELVFLESVTSTNIEVACRADMKSHGFLMVANEQTAGRGRRGRTWISQKQGNIYASLLCKPGFAPEYASMLTLVMALAVSRAIDCTIGVETQIKWPNDILLNGKKVCGILTEMRAEPDVIHHVILGVGINVNQSSFDQENLPYATSLYVELGSVVNRCELLANILSEFEQLYAELDEEHTLARMMEKYNKRLANKNQIVRIVDASQSEMGYEAKALGIDENGALIIELEDGTKHNIISGEVSVRGLYGYV
ncbi:MAG: biotin--[acetyl-CoA-carboxylase] ligase [Lachnospiraceae bacterium]